MKREQMEKTKKEKLLAFRKKFRKIKKKYQKKWDLDGFNRFGQKIIGYYAGYKEDEEAVATILPYLECVYPINQKMVSWGQYRCSLITENPQMFRMLIKSKKLDFSPNTMYCINDLGSGSTLQQNIFGILVFLGKYDFVEILLEEFGLTDWVSSEMMFRKLAPITGKMYEAEDFCFDVFSERFPTNKEEKHPLEIAFELENLKMCDSLIKHKIPGLEDIFRKQFSTRSLDFVQYFLKKSDSYKEYLDLLVMMQNYNIGLLKLYIELFGFHKVIVFFLECMKNEFYTVEKEDILYGIYIMKECCKDDSSQIEINEFEELFFQDIKDILENRENFGGINHRELCVLPYFIEYAILHGWDISECSWFDLINLYLYGKWYGADKMDESKVWFSTKVLEKKAKALLRKTDIKGYKIRKHYLQYMSVKRLQVMLNILNPQYYDKIGCEQIDWNDWLMEYDTIFFTFLAAILYKNSIVLVKAAWEKGFLHPGNLEEAVRFALTNKKQKILPVLMEFTTCYSSLDEQDPYEL